MLELQITQTRHSKSVGDRRPDRRCGPITIPPFAKATQLKIGNKTIAYETVQNTFTIKHKIIKNLNANKK